jgi:PleD family two-component response regulator
MATEEFADDDLAEDVPDPDEEVLEDELVEEVLDEDHDGTDDAESVEDEAEGEDEAFDELEAEELEMLTEDETTETLVVDEAAEMRAIRRAELAMDQQGVVEASDGEFVCSSCFLVLKTSQLANPRKKICRDCAA